MNPPGIATAIPNRKALEFVKYSVAPSYSKAPASGVVIKTPEAILRGEVPAAVVLARRLRVPDMVSPALAT